MVIVVVVDEDLSVVSSLFLSFGNVSAFQDQSSVYHFLVRFLVVYCFLAMVQSAVCLPALEEE